MVPRSILMTIFLVTFLKLTSSDRYSSWEPATSLSNSKTNDQSKKRLKQGMPERMLQFGGESMGNSLSNFYKNDHQVIYVKNGQESKLVDPSFRSRDYEYQYREEPSRHVTGGHHLNKKHHLKKRFHENLESEMSIPFMKDGDRLRRKLDDEKGNLTQNSNLTLHNGTTIEKNQNSDEENKNGTKKTCIKTNPYKIISSPSSNVTHNSSESTTLNSTSLTSKPTDQKLANNQTVHNSNGTTSSLSKDKVNQNLTATVNGKEKLSKSGYLPDKMNSTSNSSTNQANSLKQRGQGFGLPCNISGQWVSEAGGVNLNIKGNQDGSHLDVEVLESSSAKKGFLSSSWKISGNLPFGIKTINDTGAIVLTATILKDPSDNSEGKIAIFLGECRACYEGMESVMGTWILKRPSKDCMDVSLAEKEIRDVLHRDANSIAAKEQSKSESIDVAKRNDISDESRKQHLHRRYSYYKEGKHRRHTRNNLGYI